MKRRRRGRTKQTRKKTKVIYDLRSLCYDGLDCNDLIPLSRSKKRKKVKIIEIEKSDNSRFKLLPVQPEVEC